MTASRARSSDIGSEREKSRIGTRRVAFAFAFSLPDPLDFFCAIDCPSFALPEFALQQNSPRGFEGVCSETINMLIISPHLFL
ncbi:MAG TPA: hypothetical protein VK734_14510 [Bradyrhizobium sp.]|nr:hypothetical protein [Bradyrhizobium sp.]